jgi:hypothetical protein
MASMSFQFATSSPPGTFDLSVSSILQGTFSRSEPFSAEGDFILEGLLLQGSYIGDKVLRWNASRKITRRVQCRAEKPEQTSPAEFLPHKVPGCPLASPRYRSELTMARSVGAPYRDQAMAARWPDERLTRRP